MLRYHLARLTYPARAGEMLAPIALLVLTLRKSPGCPCRKCNPARRFNFVRRV